MEPDPQGYADIQATRPQKLPYNLTDSPVGQLAWIVEKFKEWTASENVPEDAVDRDRLLTALPCSPWAPLPTYVLEAKHSTGS